MNIYIPTRTIDYIEKGSALVGSQMDDGTLKVDYEGNIYGASNLHDIESRILVAAGRHSSLCPTVARRAFQPTDLEVVGTISENDWKIQITNPEKLIKWAEQYSPQ